MAFRAFSFGRSSRNNQQQQQQQQAQQQQQQAQLNQSNNPNVSAGQPASITRKAFNTGTVWETGQSTNTMINFATPINEHLLLSQSDIKNDKGDTKLLAFVSDTDHVVYKQHFSKALKEKFTQFGFLTPNIVIAITGDVIRTYNYHDWSLLQEVSLPGQPYAFKITTSFLTVPTLTPAATSSTSPTNSTNSSQLNQITYPTPPQPLIYVAVAVRKQPIHIFTFLPSQASLTPNSTTITNAPLQQPSIASLNGVGKQQQKFDTLLPRCTIPILQTVGTFGWFPLDMTQFPWLCPMPQNSIDQISNDDGNTNNNDDNNNNQDNVDENQYLPGSTSTSNSNPSGRSLSSTNQQGKTLSRFGQPVLNSNNNYDESNYNPNFSPQSLDNFSFQGSGSVGSFNGGSVGNFSFNGQDSPMFGGKQPSNSMHGNQSGPLSPNQPIQSSSTHTLSSTNTTNTNDTGINIPGFNSLGYQTIPNVAFKDSSSKLPLKAQLLVQPSQTNSQPLQNKQPVIQQRVPAPALLVGTVTNQLLLVNLEPAGVIEIDISTISLDPYLQRYPQHNRGDQLFDAIVTDKSFNDHYRVGKKQDKDKKDKQITSVPIAENRIFAPDIVAITPFPFGLLAVVIGPCVFLYNNKGKQVNLFHYLLSTTNSHPTAANNPQQLTHGINSTQFGINGNIGTDSPQFGANVPSSFGSQSGLLHAQQFAPSLSFSGLHSPSFNTSIGGGIGGGGNQPIGNFALNDKFNPIYSSSSLHPNNLPHQQQQPQQTKPTAQLAPRVDYTVYDQTESLPFCLLPYPMTPHSQPTQTLIYYTHPYIVYATLHAIIIINPYRGHDIGINTALMGGMGGGGIGGGMASNPFTTNTNNQNTNLDATDTSIEERNQAQEKQQEQQLMLFQQQQLYSLHKHLKPVQVVNFKGTVNLITSQLLPPSIFTPLQHLNHLYTIFGPKTTTNNAINTIVNAAVGQGQQQSNQLQQTNPHLAPLRITPTNSLATMTPALYAYNNTTLRVLAPVSLQQQIRQLQKAHLFQEAKLLCSLSHPQIWESDGHQEQLFKMHELILLSAFAEFMEGHYESSIMLFQTSQVNPEHVLLLFPFLLPKTFQPSVHLPDYVRPLDNGPHTLIALSALIPFLHYLRQTLLRYLGSYADKTIIHQDIYNMLSTSNTTQADLMPTSPHDDMDMGLGRPTMQNYPFNRGNNNNSSNNSNIITPEFFSPTNLFTPSTATNSTNFSSITIIEDYHASSLGQPGGQIPSNPSGGGRGIQPNHDYFSAPTTTAPPPQFDSNASSANFGTDGFDGLDDDFIGIDLNASSVQDILRTSSTFGGLQSSSSTLGSGRNIMEQKKALLLRQQQLQQQNKTKQQQQQTQQSRKNMLTKVLLPFTAYLTPQLLSLVDYAILSAYIYTDPSTVKYFLSEKVYSTAFDTIHLLASYQLHDEIVTFCRTRHLHHYVIQYLTMLIDHDVTPSASYLSNLSQLTSDHNNALSNNQQTSSFGVGGDYDMMDPTPRPLAALGDDNAAGNTKDFNAISTFVLYCRWLFHHSASAMNPAALIAALANNNNTMNWANQQQHGMTVSSLLANANGNMKNNSVLLPNGVISDGTDGVTAQLVNPNAVNSKSNQHSNTSNPKVDTNNNTNNVNTQYQQQLQHLQQSNPLGKGLIYIDDGLLIRVLEAVELISDRDISVLSRIFIPRDIWTAGVQSFLHLYQATPLDTFSSPGGQPTMTTLPSLMMLQLPTQYDSLYQFDEQYAQQHQPFSDDEQQQIAQTTNSRGNTVYQLGGGAGSNQQYPRAGRYNNNNAEAYKVPYSPTIARIIFCKLNEIWSNHQQQLQITSALQYSQQHQQPRNISNTNNTNKSNRLLGKAPTTIVNNPIGLEQQRLQQSLQDKLHELELQNSVYSIAQVPFRLNKYMLVYYLEWLITGYHHYQIVDTDLQTYYLQQQGQLGGTTTNRTKTANNTNNSTSGDKITPAFVGNQIVSLPTTTISLPLQYPKSNTTSSQSAANRFYGVDPTSKSKIPITKLDPDYTSLQFLHTQYGIYELSTLYDFFNRCAIEDKITLKTYLSAPSMINAPQPIDHSQNSSHGISSSSGKLNLLLPRSKQSPIVHLKRQIVNLFTKFSNYLNGSAMYDSGIMLSLLFTITPAMSGLNSLLPQLPSATSVFLLTLQNKNQHAEILEKNAALTTTLNRNIYHSIFLYESTELYTKLGKYDIALDIFVQLMEFQRAEALCQTRITTSSTDLTVNSSNNLIDNMNRQQGSGNDLNNIGINTDNITTVPEIMNGLNITNQNTKGNNKQQLPQQSNSFAVLFQLLLQYATHWAQQELLKRQEIEEKLRLEEEERLRNEMIQREEEERKQQELLEKQQNDLLQHNYDDARSVRSGNTTTTGVTKMNSQPLRTNKLQSAKIVSGSSVTMQTVPVKLVSGTSTADAAAVSNQLATSDAKIMTPYKIKTRNLRGGRSTRVYDPATGQMKTVTEGDNEDDADITDNDNDSDENGNGGDGDDDDDNNNDKDKNTQLLSPYLEAALQLLASNPNKINLCAAFNSLFHTQTTLPPSIKQQQLLTTSVIEQYNSSNPTQQPQQQTAVSLPISTVYPLCSHLLSSLHEHQRQQLVLRALHKKQLYSTKTVLQHHQQTFFNVDSLKTCGSCFKKIQNSAFVLIPCQFLLEKKYIDSTTDAQQNKNIQNKPSGGNTLAQSPNSINSSALSVFSINVPVNSVTRLRGNMHPSLNNDENLPQPVVAPQYQQQVQAAQTYQNNALSKSSMIKPTPDVMASFGGLDEDDFGGYSSNNLMTSFAAPNNDQLVYVITPQNITQFASFKVFLHYICFNSIKNEQNANLDDDNDGSNND